MANKYLFKLRYERRARIRYFQKDVELKSPVTNGESFLGSTLEEASDHKRKYHPHTHLQFAYPPQAKLPWKLSQPHPTFIG